MNENEIEIVAQALLDAQMSLIKATETVNAYGFNIDKLPGFEISIIRDRFLKCLEPDRI